MTASKKSSYFRYYHGYYKLPVCTQVMFRRMQILVDRYARIARDGSILYTRKDSPDTTRRMKPHEIKRIFVDLYGEPMNASHTD